MSDNQNVQVPVAGEQSTPAQQDGLAGLLSSREYQAPPPGLVVNEETGQIENREAVTPIPQAYQTPQGAGIPGQVAATQVAQGQQPQVTTPNIAAPQEPAAGVTTQPQGLSDAERRALADAQARAAQLEDVARRQAQVLQQQAIDAARREDEAFYNAVQAKLDSGELEARQATELVRRREAEKTERVNRFYREREEARTQQDTINRTQQAKAAVISRVMLLEGIPASYRPLLEQAETPDHMEYTLNLIRPLLQQQVPTQQMGQSPQQQSQAPSVQAIRQELQESGVLNPAGDGAGAPPPEPPKPRSGDLVGLLGSREYQYGSAQ